MRREQLAYWSMIVFLETNRFIQEPQYYPSITLQLPHPTDHAGEIIQTALSGLDTIYRDGYRNNKGRVMLSGLIIAKERKTSLLDPYDREKIASLMLALDQVNTTFGPGTLRFGSQGFRRASWQMRQNHLSSNNNQGLMTEHQQVKRICELGKAPR